MGTINSHNVQVGDLVIPSRFNSDECDQWIGLVIDTALLGKGTCKRDKYFILRSDGVIFWAWNWSFKVLQKRAKRKQHVLSTHKPFNP